MPLLNTAAVILAMWAMVARGAVSTVREPREAAMMLFRSLVLVGERTAEQERLTFSTRGVFEGEGVGDGVISVAFFKCWSRVSASMRSIARRQMSKALRRSPDWAATFLERNMMAVGWMNGSWVEPGGRRAFSFEVMTEDICVALYGRNGSSSREESICEIQRVRNAN